MAPNYAPLTISRALDASLRDIQTAAVQNEDARQTLGVLLQSALQLEFATIPTYLSAAFSVTPNRKIYQLIRRIAVEEMLHLTTVANLMNAIGIPPDIVAAVPKYPCELAILEPPLKLDLESFSFKLVEKLFMAIEAPEVHVDFRLLVAAPKPRTIGQFYAGIIEIIKGDTIPDLFKHAERDAYKQRAIAPNFGPVAYLSNQDAGTYPLGKDINFIITNKDSADRHLSWVVDEGEGEAPYDPLDSEGLPGHHYRFESILRGHYLIKDTNAPKGYSFSGGDLPFDPAGVHEFDTNAKAEDYGNYPEVQEKMQLFNEKYADLVNLLQTAFNCPSPDQQEQAAAAYELALSSMRSLPGIANTIIKKAKEKHIKAGIPFQYPLPAVS